ncbi:heme peroxidase [Xylariales sp. PMI_506]|nr:heme peroxidase [Xylariales sp. PMI_506]
MVLTFGQRLLIWTFKAVNFVIPWHRLPRWVGVINLLALRYELRDENLYDTYGDWDAQGTATMPAMPDTKFNSVRNSDGYFNDLERPKMGGRCMRFGRNVPRKYTAAPSHNELMTPNPRVISNTLLAREDGHFKPATIVNLLAAAWIQFQVHDWAQHFRSTQETWDVPVPTKDSWPDRFIKIFKTIRDDQFTEEDVKAPAYQNENTHWWDGSQIYGSTEEETAKLRSKCDDGKIAVDVVNGAIFLPRGEDGIPLTGFNQNWWVGLELLHTLFALEHNAICGQLKLTNPAWTGDQLFDTARLINCALMAKIHTIEWTPAILKHPALQLAMGANWWGLAGEKLWKIFGRISKDSEAVSGIPGSGAEQDGVPYALTEEFVSVYRLHPLIPDDIAFFGIRDGAHRTTKPIGQLAFAGARSPFEKDGLSFADAFYSFGINYPGAITHHNTPDFLRDLHLPDGSHLDMGAVDILRDRERGVPRYNQFRRLFHMPAARTFLQLTGGDAPLAAQLSNVYGGDVELIDLLVGCLCEPLPAGFGFSDTAFRVFILMASRRLKSDRFIAGQWNVETYTRAGLDWVQNNTMADVLCRHFPELRPALNGVGNAFAPWNKVGVSGLYGGKETNAVPFNNSPPAPVITNGLV